MRKRTIALLLVLAALAGAAVSRAYLFALGRGRAENVITYGSLQMKLWEWERDGEGNLAPVADWPLRLTGTPSQRVSRVIQAENTCQEPMYLRMRLSIAGTSDDGKTLMPLSEEEVTFAANTGAGEDGGKWLAKADGWYYYSAVLEPGARTATLLEGDQVLFHTDVIAGTRPNEELTLSVEVQAVQSVHNPEGKVDVLAAQGWPKEVKGG